MAEVVVVAPAEVPAVQLSHPTTVPSEQTPPRVSDWPHGFNCNTKGSAPPRPCQLRWNPAVPANISPEEPQPSKGHLAIPSPNSWLLPASARGRPSRVRRLWVSCRRSLQRLHSRAAVGAPQASTVRGWPAPALRLCSHLRATFDRCPHEPRGRRAAAVPWAGGAAVAEGSRARRCRRTGRGAAGGRWDMQRQGAMLRSEKNHPCP